jgi:sensor histidine kinase regulating citrate/malate metabolism
VGIKARLTSSYFLVVFLTILLFIFSIIFFLRQYYYQNIEEMLVNQAEISANFYERYLSGDGLENQSHELLESISLNTDAQVQIIDAKGQVLENSHGTLSSNEQLSSPDIMQALEGNIGVWRGSTINQESILAISYPLIQNELTIGAIRLTTSLSMIENIIQRTTLLLILIGFFVILIVIIISLLLSRTITEPIKNLTNVAEQMAKGDFSARLKKQEMMKLENLRTP